MTKVSELLPDIGRPVAYYAELAPLVGGPKAALLLCQLLYWSDKGTYNDNWIFKNVVELEAETGLSYQEQRAARRELKSRGLIRESHQRKLHKLFFQVNFDELCALWERR